MDQWKWVDRGSSTHLENENGETVMMFYKGDGGVGHHEFAGDIAKSRDGRLIAAAPEMFEFLLWFVRMAPQPVDTVVWDALKLISRIGAK